MERSSAIQAQKDRLLREIFKFYRHICSPYAALAMNPKLPRVETIYPAILHNADRLTLYFVIFGSATL